jgi:hypothetical protein
MAGTPYRNPSALPYFDGGCGRADSGGQRGSTDRSYTGESLLLRRSDGQYRKPWQTSASFLFADNALGVIGHIHEQVVMRPDERNAFVKHWPTYRYQSG